MVTRAQVLHIARLARLELSAEEVERFRFQLARILEYVGELREIEEEPGEAPPPPGLECERRPDEPAPCLSREKVLAQAPWADGETFRVPAVLEDAEGT